MTLRTTPVRFTRGPVGLVDASEPNHFIASVAQVGEHGDLIVEGDLPFEVPEGWVLVRVGPFYAPVHPGMVEPLDSRAVCLGA